MIEMDEEQELIRRKNSVEFHNQNGLGKGTSWVKWTRNRNFAGQMDKEHGFYG